MKDMERYELCLRLSQAEKDMLEKNLKALIWGVLLWGQPSEPGPAVKFGSLGLRYIALVIISIKSPVALIPVRLRRKLHKGLCSCWGKFMK